MILASDILGNIQSNSAAFDALEKDYLALDWFEVDSGRLRRQTTGGRDIGFKNSKGTSLKNGDVLFYDAKFCVVVRVLPCLCLIIRPSTQLEMAKICFDIGNRHIPIAIRSESELMVAFEEPLYHLFEKQGYSIDREIAVLEQTQTLRIHQWTRNTKFKVTLAKNIHESFIDTASN